MESQQYQELLNLLHQLLKDQTAAKEHATYELAAARRETEYLKSQLAMTNALLAAKDETISLLRASYNRPN